MQVPPFIALSEDLRRRLDYAALAAAADPAGVFHLDFDNQAVPAVLVRWLLLDAMPALGGKVSRLEIARARVDERIDLIGARLTLTFSFGGCTLAGIDLTDSTAIGIEIIGGSIGFVRADRLSMTGSLLLRGVREDPAWRRRPPAGAGRTLSIPQGILLSGAKIHGNLDLRGAHLGPLDGMEYNACVALLADGLQVDGNALFSDGFSATGEVRLNGSRVGRSLDCTNGKLSNPGGFSFSAAGAHVDGSVFLCAAGGAAMTSIGTVRLDGAEIGGHLDAHGGTFTATAFHRQGWQRIGGGADNKADLDAFVAIGTNISGSFVCRSVTARGQVNVMVAKIGGDMIFTGALLHFPGEEVLFADSVTVLGAVYLDNARTSGLLRFVQANVRQGFYCDDMQLDIGGVRQGWAICDGAVAVELGPDVCGVYASGAKLGGSFIWKGVTRRGNARASHRQCWLSAPGAAITEVADDPASWLNSLDRIDLTDCTYASVGTYARPSNLTDQIKWRLYVLDREYAAWNLRYRRPYLSREILRRTRRGERTKLDDGLLGRQILRFIPGPYLQLARVARQSGFEGAADDILRHLEQNRTNYSGFGWPGLLWRWIISGVLKYGQAPFRPALYLLAWLFISGPLFKWVHDARIGHWVGAMQPAKPEDHLRFDWLFYTIDTLVPFVDFGQKKDFVIDPRFSFGGLLLLFNALLGYAAIGFLAAGLTSLVRTGKDS